MNFPAYTPVIIIEFEFVLNIHWYGRQGQEDKGILFSQTSRIALPYMDYKYSLTNQPWLAVESFVFWLNVPAQTTSNAIIFSRFNVKLLNF